MGGHPIPYGFSGYLDALGDDWSHPDTDPVLAAWLTDLDRGTRDWVTDVGRQAAGPLRDLADFVERPENRPRLAGKGPYDNDPQQVVLPAETWDMLAAVHGSGLWRKDLPEQARYAATYLLNQNGEAGVTCSVACTDGLQRVLRAHDAERNRTILRALEEADPDDWVHGAQFVTEIQGGSDAGTNAVRAEPVQGDAGTYTLHGQKWFCSNLTADWWLVTARPEEAPDGAGGVALFCVPRDQDGYTVERLKDKLGTRALPTAEITFHGASGWPVGPLDRGLAIVVGEVLVTSRIHNVVAAAGFLRRAVREADAYAAFRTAFGQRLDDLPLLAEPLGRLRAAADRTEAGAFATVDAWLASKRDDATGPENAWVRVLVSLAKAVTTRRTPGQVYEAMMTFGGNGIEERFSALPRLWRDAAILETWEGPYTLLLAQALGDLRRFQVAGDEAAFLAPLGDRAEGLAPRLAHVLEDPDDPERQLAWRVLAHDLYEAWEAQALRRLLT